jgi:hypothetical protein
MPHSPNWPLTINIMCEGIWNNLTYQVLTDNTWKNRSISVVRETIKGASLITLCRTVWTSCKPPGKCSSNHWSKMLPTAHAMILVPVGEGNFMFMNTLRLTLGSQPHHLRNRNWGEGYNSRVKQLQHGIAHHLYTCQWSKVHSSLPGGRSQPVHSASELAQVVMWLWPIFLWKEWVSSCYSVVSTVTGLQAGRYRVPIQAVEEIFSSPNHPDQLWGPTSLLLNG